MEQPAAACWGGVAGVFSKCMRFINLLFCVTAFVCLHVASLASQRFCCCVLRASLSRALCPPALSCVVFLVVRGFAGCSTTVAGGLTVPPLSSHVPVV